MISWVFSDVIWQVALLGPLAPAPGYFPLSVLTQLSVDNNNNWHYIPPLWNLTLQDKFLGSQRCYLLCPPDHFSFYSWLWCFYSYWCWCILHLNRIMEASLPPVPTHFDVIGWLTHYWVMSMILSVWMIHICTWTAQLWVICLGIREDGLRLVLLQIHCVMCTTLQGK